MAGYCFSDSSGFNVRGTRRDGEDDGGADGWWIANQAIFDNGNGWVFLSDTALKRTVTGTADTVDTLSPLTARFQGVPESHDGSKFKLRVSFSERISTPYKKLATPASR